MIRPSFARDDSAISYFKEGTREAYSYKRYLGYTYQRRRGRRRRVHHYKTIHVPARTVLYWVVEAPPPPPALPKPKTSREIPRPKGWIHAAEWQDFLDQWAQNQGIQIEWDGDIYKKSPASDVIARDLFVWPHARYPRNVSLKGYPDMGNRVFVMVRLWVLIEHTEDEEMFAWVRTVRIFDSTFDEAKVEVEKISKAIERDVEDFPYLSFRGVIGWTLYTIEQKSVRRAKKEGTE